MEPELKLEIWRRDERGRNLVIAKHGGYEHRHRFDIDNQRERKEFCEAVSKRFNLMDEERFAIEPQLVAGAAAADGEVAKPELVSLSSVEPQAIDYLWPNRIAVGKLTLVAGIPGVSKSLFTMDTAARVSRGAAWPDVTGIRQQPGGVVLLSAEDDLADTIRPRLDAHEADCSRITALTAIRGNDGDGEYRRGFDLQRDLERLSSAIDATAGCRLVIIDPISAYLGKADGHSNSDIRALLAPLSELAALKRVATLAVSHLRKADGDAISRVMGSLAFVAAARAAWLICRCRENPHRRLLLPVKNNLSPDNGTGLAFTVESHGADGAPVICWEGEPVLLTADEAMSPEPRKRGPAADDLTFAVKWLESALANGPRLAREVTEEATHGKCISKRTLDRARRAVGVIAYRETNRGPWHWRLSDANPAKIVTLPNTTPHKQLGNLGNVAFPPEIYIKPASREFTLPSSERGGPNGNPAHDPFAGNGHGDDAVNRLFAEAETDREHP